MLAAAPGKYWLPPDISAHGQEIDSLITWMHYFMAVLFIGWGIFFVYCLVRFRQRSGQSAQYAQVKAKPSKYAEIAVVVVETVLLLFFSIPIWKAYRAEPPPRDEDPLEVRVIAQQFAWNVHYAGEDGVFGPTDPKLVDEQENPIGLDRSHPAGKDDIVTLNNLHVPVDKPVIVRLTSKDVIHSFWIPYLRVKQDTIPGMEIPVWFTATQTTDQVRERLVRAVPLPLAGDDQAAVRFVAQTKNWIATQDYADKNGDPILKTGDMMFNADKLPVLRDAGISELTMAPNQPMEIQCAQLCGLNHYSMRGFFMVDTAEQFAQFMADEAEELEGDDDDWGDDEDEWGEEEDDEA